MYLKHGAFKTKDSREKILIKYRLVFLVALCKSTAACMVVKSTRSVAALALRNGYSVRLNPLEG